MRTTETHAGSARMAAPKPPDEDLDFFGMSDQGKVRKNNEDAYLYCTLHKSMRVWGTNLPNRELLELPSQRLASFAMVADGVGGHSRGEVASRAALEAVAGYVIHTMQSFYTTNSMDETAFIESLRHAAHLGHDAIMARAEASGDQRAMATTLTVMIAAWPNLYVLHVGDSRCYRYREGSVQQLTRDQTMAQDLVDAGALPPDRAASSPFSRILASSLGGKTTVPVVTKTNLQPGDVIMLCTDGLTKHVSDETITARLGGLTSSEQACRALVDDALAGGGTDNVTVLVLRAIVRPGAAAGSTSPPSL